MKFQKFFLSMIVTAAFSGMLDSAVALANPTPPPAPPENLKPLRTAPGRIKMFRYSMTVDADGKSHFKSEDLCAYEVPVPVFDLRNAGENASIVPVHVVCNDSLAGRPIGVHSYSYLSLSKGDKVGRSEDIKVFQVGNFASISDQSKEPIPDFPRIPRAIVFTTDLQQVYFGTLSEGEQHTVCQDKKCRVVNPVTYGIRWEVQDHQQ